MKKISEMSESEYLKYRKGRKERLITDMSMTEPVAFENSMLGAILSGDKKKLKRIEKHAKKGGIVRIM